jgi:hypothetical protein
MTEQDKAADEAVRLLPCLWAAHGGRHPYSQARGKPCECSTCLRRPDIAAALRQRDERIAELEAAKGQLTERMDAENVRLRAKLAVADSLIGEVMRAHKDPKSADYNECNKALCSWCELWQKEYDLADSAHRQ